MVDRIVGRPSLKLIICIHPNTKYSLLPGILQVIHIYVKYQCQLSKIKLPYKVFTCLYKAFKCPYKVYSSLYSRHSSDFLLPGHEIVRFSRTTENARVYRTDEICVLLVRRTAASLPPSSGSSSNLLRG